MSAATPSSEKTTHDASSTVEQADSATVAWFGLAAILAAAVIILAAVATVMV